mmetsp:Transcript_19925/g.34284  ORF Transcript_19925/g.34284 Transcript_19925/m.34284 type:complete len:117 (+) Transcript_19925:255-605(+)
MILLTSLISHFYPDWVASICVLNGTSITARTILSQKDGLTRRIHLHENTSAKQQIKCDCATLFRRGLVNSEQSQIYGQRALICVRVPSANGKTLKLLSFYDEFTRFFGTTTSREGL